MRCWLLILALSLGALAQEPDPPKDVQRGYVERPPRSAPPYVHHEVIALREAIWALREAADRGDLRGVCDFADQVWRQWIDLEDPLRRSIKAAYPQVERQMDDLKPEALALARQTHPTEDGKKEPPAEAPPKPEPPKPETPKPETPKASERPPFPGYRDPLDLFGNSGLGRRVSP